MITSEIRDLVTQAAQEGTSWPKVEEALSVNKFLVDSDIEYLRQVYDRNVQTNEPEQADLSHFEKNISQNMSDIEELKRKMEALDHDVLVLQSEVAEQVTPFVRIPNEEVENAPFWIRSWIAKHEHRA